MIFTFTIPVVDGLLVMGIAVVVVIVPFGIVLFVALAMAIAMILGERGTSGERKTTYHTREQPLR